VATAAAPTAPAADRDRRGTPAPFLLAPPPLLLMLLLLLLRVYGTAGMSSDTCTCTCTPFSKPAR
jgi:hypothetical protein